MKKLLFALVAATSSLAQAAQVDCSTPVLVQLERVGYKELAEFPNAPKIVQFSPWELKQPRSFCGVSFARRGNTLSVRADKLEYFAYMTTSGRQSGRMKLSGLTTRPGKADGVDITVSIDKYSTMFNVQALLPPDLTKTAAVAARIDGGKLQPLYWPGVGFSTVEFPKTAKIVDVYLKTDEPSEGAPIAVPVDLQISAYLSPPVRGGRIRSGFGHRARCGASRRCSRDATQ